MANRSAGRGRTKSDDSQLEFFKLTFGGLQPATPSASPTVESTNPVDLTKGDSSPTPGGAIAIGNIPSLEEATIAPPPLDELSPSEKFFVEKPALRNQNNYCITDEDQQIGRGSLKAKCRANIAAIKLLKRIESESRSAIESEKKILVRYVGWGGLPQVFDSLNDDWKQEREDLETLLTTDELESARATTLNAHYTSPTVVRAMYAALMHFGFEHGRILEPACGTGHFIGLMPGDMTSRSQITGIEIDSLTARLAKLLYPDADIRHQPFEEAKLGENFYDVSISNVPFGDYRPFDPRFRSWNFVIHDYFFASALDKVRPGGLVLFITSKGTLDKVEGCLREYVSQQADLLGAVRLPNDAFKRTANTEVTTDILMLRKRLPGKLPSEVAWKTVKQITNSLGETITVNEYYSAHPEMMLGEMRLEGRMYQRGEPTLSGNDRDLGEQLSEAIARLPANVFRPRNCEGNAPLSVQTIPAPEDVKPNAYALVQGQIAVRDGDTMRVVTDLPAMTAQRIRGLVRVRDAVRRCLRVQLEDQGESDVISAREQLNQNYDYFVNKFGPISESSNMAAFRADPDLPLLLSLERYDEHTRRAEKAAIFRERTIQRNRTVLEIKAPKDALLVTLNARGAVDMQYLSGLLHRAPTDFLPELSGVVFLDPQTNRWETEDAYLSGNVRVKLKVAEAASLVDAQFKVNVTALAAVQPSDLAATEIDARLGSTWIRSEDITSFAEHLLGENSIRVAHVPGLGLWQVRAGWSAKMSVANTAEWGTDRRTGLDLLEDALNLRTPTVYDQDDRTERKVVNVSATEAARDKQQKIKDRFKDWIWRDDERRETLLRKYNDEFNNIRLRTFNGDHLTLPEQAKPSPLTPTKRQRYGAFFRRRTAFWRTSSALEKPMSWLPPRWSCGGLVWRANPLFAVPNHMLGQFASELLTLYPGANILVATKEDFEKTRRQTLMSRIATGNWDAVIVTHAGFEKISVSRETQEEFFKEQMRELSLAIEQQREDSRIVKTLERAKKRLETRLKVLSGVERKDGALTFEELGVDRLFIDEAHYFKNLFYVSKMTRISGLPQTASQRAMDMLLKVSHVERMNGGGGVVFATGTPIANSVAEMFTMQRYLQMASLKALKVDHFDSWAATFGEPVTAMELAPDGSGYRLHTRFARFINVPELMQQFRQVADVQTQTMLKLRLPDLKNGKRSISNAPCSEELKKIVASLVERAESLRGGLVDPSTDNMLMVTSDGRKAALDLRLYNSSLPDHPASKLNLAVAQIHRIWRDTEIKRSAQLVFCDLSTPTGGKGFSVYEDAREKLITLGVPESEIAFMQDYDSDADKVTLFRDVRAGRVRILFGSTQKMGSGTNVQERLIALHHLDAPWRPADVEQREGRILRQGNSNPEIEIYRYVTEASFDAYMWQTLETKAKFIAQVMTGESDLRRIEDIDGTALTYAEVKAIASGNPLVIEKAGVDAEVARLGRLQMQHHETQYRLRQRVRHLTADLPRLEKRLEESRDDVLRRQDTRAEHFVIELRGESIRDRGIAGELINRHAARVQAAQGEQRIGTFAGFDLYVAGSFMGNAAAALKGAGTHEAKITDTALGTMRSIEYAVQNLEETIFNLEQAITETRERISDLTVQSALPFDYAEKLSSLVQRQQEIADALDLTKNQAANQLESDSDDNAAVASEQGAVCLSEMGFPEYEY